MDSHESTTAQPTTRRRLHRGILTAGAVVAMVLAGLGVAEAQTEGTTSTTAAEADRPTSAEDRRHGPGCHHRHRHRHGRQGMRGHKPKLDIAAKTIGISREDLMTALRDGQSIAHVARSKDVDPQKVIDAMVAEAKEHLAESVEKGRLTKAQADKKAAKLTERITDVVNREGLRLRGGPRPARA